MSRRPLFWKKTKPTNTRVKPKKFYPAIEQLEIRQMLTATTITNSFQRVTDPEQAQSIPFGTATVFPNTGTFQISEPLDFDQSPGTSVGRNPALVYDSATVAPRPIIEATLLTNSALGLPTSIQATLTFNGTAQSAVTFSTSGHSAGDTYTIDTQDATALTSTGAYSWSLSIKTFYSTETDTNTASGTTYAVVNNTVAAGWSYAGVDQLVAVSGGIMYVYGSGGFRVFTGSGPTYTSPANDFGTLVENVGGSYTYTAENQTQYNFNSSGMMTSVVDPDSQAVTYTYSSGALSEVQTPDGAVTTMTLGSNRGHAVWFIYETGGRVDELILLSSTVTSAAEDINGRFFGASGGFLTTDSWSPQAATFTYDGTTGLLSSIDRGSGTTLSLAPAAAYGLATSPAAGANPVAVTTDGLSQLTTFTLDSQGRTTRLATPDGAVTTYSLDGAGHVTVLTDPMNRVTTYTYGTGAAADNLLQVTNPDDSNDYFAYDSTYHELTQSTDALGNITTYTLDGTGDVTRIEDAKTEVTTFVWSNGLLQSETTPLNHTTTFLYDSSRRLTTTIDALTDRTTYTYDSTGNPLTTTDALGHVSTTTYDGMNNLTETINALSGTSSSTYEPDGQVSTQTDPLGNTATFTYDTRGWNLVTEQGATSGGLLIPDDGTSITSNYNADGYMTSQLNGNGFATTYTYDPMGRVKTMESPVAGVTTYVYDLDGELTSVTDPLNHTTSYTYNNRGLQTSVEDPLTNVSTAIYDTQGNETVSIDARGERTTMTYDQLNRLVTSDNALGGVSTIVYDADGNETVTINPLGGRTTTTYDALDRLTTVTDPLSRTSTTVYDAVNNVIRTIDPMGNTVTYTYDALNRQTSEQDPSGGIVTTVYDADSDVINTIDQVGDTTTYVYDALNRKVETIDPRGGIVTTVYDADNNVINVIDQVGNKTTFVYDAADRKTEEINPLNETTTFAYDLANNLTSQTDAIGQKINYSYDADNRETGEVWKNASGVTTDTVTYTYDAVGNTLTAGDANGTYTYTYDALNRGTRIQEPFSVVLTQAFDANSNRTLMQDSFSGVTTFVYDADNELTSEQFGGVGLTPLRMDMTYNADGELSGETRYSNLAGTTVVGTSSYTYDGAGDLTNLQQKNGSGTNIANYTYTYDLAHRLTSETLNGGSPTSYTYDADSELTNDGVSSYTYDLAGNRTMAGYTITADNQLADAGAWSYSYDADGNLLSKTEGPSLDTVTNSYNVNNQLVGVTTKLTTGGTLLSQVTYVYDVLGNRIEEDSWTSGSGSTVTRFAYDGQNAFADLNSSNALVTRRLYLNGVDTIFARISAAGTAAWYLTDRLGSVRGMTDASGAVQATITYDGFGNVLSNSNSSFTDRYQYTGRELDSVTGLQYNRARYYDPTIGRWTQEDPIGFEAGDTNLYRYVSNSSPNRTDPFGKLGIEFVLSVLVDQLADNSFKKRENAQNTLLALSVGNPNAVGKVTLIRLRDELQKGENKDMERIRRIHALWLDIAIRNK